MAALRAVVHSSGVATFESLPGDTYEFRVDYEQAQGRVWLKSTRTAREWFHDIDNRAAFDASPSFRDQFSVEITLFELALQYDSRVHKTDACKNVLLARSRDDLVLQLSKRVYTRRNPMWQPPIAFTLEWVRGTGIAPHGMSRDPPTPLVLAEPPRMKLPREEQQKDTIARLREENKALKAAKRDRAGDSRQYKTDNDALRREVQQLRTTNDAQYAELIKLGSSHEFQRQHIEHLRRKIQALQQQQQLAPSDDATSQISPAVLSDPLAVAPIAADLETKSLDRHGRTAVTTTDTAAVAGGGEPTKRRRVEM